jgi:hypothetical protein
MASVSPMRRPAISCALLGVLAAGVGCGDHVVRSVRETAAVLISRDSVSLEVGDTIALRAEARDMNGDPIVDVAVIWAVLDPLVATLEATGGSARVATVGPGAGRIVARAGDHADTAVMVVPAPLTATTLSRHEDTLEALGAETVVLATSQSATGPRSGRYTATARDPAIVQAAARGPGITLTALAPGVTYVTVVERHGTEDSIRAVVRQREATVELTPNPVGGFSGRNHQVVAIVEDPRGNAIPGAPVIFTTLDSSVATVSPSGLVTFARAGTGHVEARSPAGPADTGTVIVQPTPPLFLSPGSVHVGTGLLSEALLVADNGDDVSPWVHLAITDTGVAQAPDSVLLASQGGTFRISGKRAGTTTLLATSPLMAPDTLAIRVSTSHIQLSDQDYGYAPYPPSPLVSLGSQRRFTIVAQDSLGATLDPAEPVAVTVVSSDTAVLTLPDSRAPYTIPPRDQGATVFTVIPVDTGRAMTVATTATLGIYPDTFFYVVIPMPKLRFLEGRLHILGAEQRSTELSAITTTQGVDHGSDVLVTFTRRHPEVATFPDTLTLPTNAVGWPFGYTGLIPGADTIVASAPGYEPDTAILVVTTPHFILPDTVYGTTVGGGTVLFVADTLGTLHATDSALLVLATPSDTTVARPSSTRIPAQFFALWPLPIPIVDTGRTLVTVTDSAGRYAPKSFALLVSLDSSIRVGVQSGFGRAAPRMRFEETAFVLSFPPSPPPGRVVHLAATNRGVLRIPDSVIVVNDPSFTINYSYFPVAASDTVGTTRIIATARGFVPDTSDSVVVVPGHLKLYAPDSAIVGYPGYVAEVVAQNLDGAALSLDTSATYTLVSLDSGIVVDSNATVAAGETYSPQIPLTFTAPGRLRLAVEDHRGVIVPYRGDSVTIAVVPPRLILAAESPAVIGVGQQSFAGLRRTGSAADDIMVTIRHSGSRTASVPSIRMTPGLPRLTSPFAIEGRAGGPDTIFVSAPGYDGDSVSIQVSDGSVSLYNWPGQLRQGDSAGVSLVVRDSLGVVHPVAAGTTFAIVKEGGITFTEGSRVVNSITVPAGTATSPVFKVKAIGPAGPAHVRFVNLYYSDQAFQVTVTQ